VNCLKNEDIQPYAYRLSETAFNAHSGDESHYKYIAKEFIEVIK